MRKIRIDKFVATGRQTNQFTGQKVANKILGGMIQIPDIRMIDN